MSNKPSARVKVGFDMRIIFAQNYQCEYVGNFYRLCVDAVPPLYHGLIALRRLRLAIPKTIMRPTQFWKQYSANNVLA